MHLDVLSKDFSDVCDAYIAALTSAKKEFDASVDVLAERYPNIDDDPAAQTIVAIHMLRMERRADELAAE
jgi:hypothetical protein